MITGNTVERLMNSGGGFTPSQPEAHPAAKDDNLWTSQRIKLRLYGQSQPGTDQSASNG